MPVVCSRMLALRKARGEMLTRPMKRILIHAGGVAMLCAGCGHAAPGPAPTTVRLTTGPAGGGFYPIGERLGTAWSRMFSNMTINVQPSGGGVANVEAIQAGTADVGF